ncbi:MAG: type II toxin-antitoxin system Phd/YefM family antitoxin [Nitrososphaera sp.]
MPKKEGLYMTKNIPAFLARTQFGQILERVSKNKERFLVTKKGEARAVILGVEDFLRAMVKTPESLSALQEQAKKRKLDKLTLEEIEKKISAVRRIKHKTNYDAPSSL